MTDAAEEITTKDVAQKSQKKSKRNIPAMIFCDGKLTVNMPSTALNQVMNEVSHITGIKVLWQGLESTRQVTLGFKDRTVAESVKHILSGENYMLLFSSQDREQMIDTIIILPPSDVANNSASFARSSAGMDMFTENEPEEMMLPDLVEMDILTENEREEMMELENEMAELRRTQSWQ
jgi:hypothetical protein